MLSSAILEGSKKLKVEITPGLNIEMRIKTIHCSSYFCMYPQVEVISEGLIRLCPVRDVPLQALNFQLNLDIVKKAHIFITMPKGSEKSETQEMRK